ncbi:DUF445 family protein [Clostridium folliculivorans]|uniref:DUF445 family protein n=1 Tax=Clostridium folliculivorans TaxID=2886038 RepID=A0A9W6DBB1_9CLOT|nr:DUF445 family protein [Clostridium folliculivorans]GKU26084.1 hypothetical protein CFOLD11_29110 [Clostridium folliculivorans]GKU28170.1 hypothetical protein CFB3_02760 [Clostridium folliculivorans]
MKYFFGVLIGAIIGYITNWVAIKMLFRPHYEKRLFGIKLPFTPGLIPKEKARISKSVGETVGNHLLTNDVMISALSNDNIKKHLKNMIEKKIGTAKDLDKSLDEVLENKIGEYYKKLKIRLQVKASSYAISKVRNEEFIDSVSKLIMNKINITLLEKPDKLKELFSGNGFCNNVLNDIPKSIDKSKIAQCINQNINKSLEDLVSESMKIEDIIPLEVLSSINTYIYNERNAISKQLLSILREDKVEEKVKEAIKNNVLSGMSPLVSMFLNVDSVYDKFLLAIDGYLENDENKILLVTYLGTVIINFGKKQVKDVLDEIPQESRESLTEILSASAVEKLITTDILEEGLKLILDKIDSFESYHHILILLAENYEDRIEKYIKSTIKTLVISGMFEEKIKSAIDILIKEISNTSITKLLSNYDGSVNDKLDKLIENIYDKFINEEGANIIHIIDIPKIVEDQINSFDVDYAEKIILDIASKELSAITWLGALLGGILGVLSPILASIGS